MKPHRLLLLLILLIAAGCCPAQDTDKFEAVRSYLDESVKNGKVAGGSVLVAHRGKTIFQTGFGFTDQKTKTPFQVNTPVVIASISKPILGTTLYRLVDEGKLDVSAPITKYLPEFADRKLESGEALKRAPTLTELLTHTSGLRFDDAPDGRVWQQEWSRNQTLEFVVSKIARDFPFKAQPGVKFAYSGIGTEVAARVGEVVSGLSRNELLVTHLCKPLGMKETFYLDAAGLKQLGRSLPTRYYRSKKSGELLAGAQRVVPQTNRYSSSGGAIVSTAPDLLKWLLMIRNGGVHEGRLFLKPDTITRLLRQHELGNRARGGLAVRTKDAAGKPVVLGHTGSSGTDVWIDLKNDAIGIMLTQTRGTDISDFRIELERRITAALEKSQ